MSRNKINEKLHANDENETFRTTWKKIKSVYKNKDKTSPDKHNSAKKRESRGNAQTTLSDNTFEVKFGRHQYKLTRHTHTDSNRSYKLTLVSEFKYQDVIRIHPAHNSMKTGKYRPYKVPNERYDNQLSPDTINESSAIQLHPIKIEE